MEEIKRERKEYDILYKATDGTEFTSKKECEAYENSAKGVLMDRYTKLIVRSDTECNLFDMGSDDFVIDIVRVPDKDAYDCIMQLFYLHNSYVIQEDCTEQRDKVIQRVESALKDNDCLIVHRGCNSDDFWPVNTKSAFVQKVLSAFESE